MYKEIRHELQKKLQTAGVDVYIACTPSNFYYLSGYQSAFIDLSWQMTGTDLVVMFADPALAPAIIISEYSEAQARSVSDVEDIRTYLMWTENRDFSIVGRPDAEVINRPEQYDPEEIFGLVSNIVAGRGLVNPVIGSDLSLMKHATYEALAKQFSGHQLVDCEKILYEARCIKHPGEIAHIRQAARLFDIGVAQTAARIIPGQSADEMRANFDEAIREAVRETPGCGRVDKAFFFPHVGTSDQWVAQPGDIVKIDCGVRVNGYWSDGCRHFSLGGPDQAQLLIHNALHAGFCAALELIRPGVRMKDIYQAAINAVRRNGIPGYSRGHFGHSIGLDDQTEEPPFIGPNDATIEENMVICLELPYYPADIGGFNIEDMLLVTGSGYECLTALSRELIVL